MACSSAVTGSALAEAVLLALVLAAVIWAVLLAVTVLVVVSVADSVDVCSLAVASVAVLSAVEVDDVVVELLDVRRDVAPGRLDEPDAVDAAAVFCDDVDDLPAVLSSADEAVDLGARAVWPVAFFADPELDVAELEESDAELWSVSSALATAMPGPASESPSASAAIPALAPR